MALIAIPISSDIAKLIGFGGYGIGVGLVNALVLARWIPSHSDLKSRDKIDAR